MHKSSDIVVAKVEATIKLNISFFLLLGPLLRSFKWLYDIIKNKYS